MVQQWRNGRATINYEVRLDAGIELPARTSRFARPIGVGENVSVSIRPEQMAVTRAALRGGNAFATNVEILNRIFLGEHTEYLVRDARLGVFFVLQPRGGELGERPFDLGETVHLSWRQEAAIALPTGTKDRKTETKTGSVQ